MPGITISKEDIEKLGEAVGRAESKTSGEIATAFIKESDNYAIYELMFAVVCGFVYFMVAMFFISPIEAVIRNMTWDYSVGHLPAFFGFSIFVVIAVFYVLANLSFIDRLIVPRGVMRRKVHERAVRHFMESGVYDTRDRTGILIFISALERRVEVLADKGIAAKIDPERWDRVVAVVTTGIRENRLVESLTTAIGICGDLLAEHFPIQPDDTDELKNRIDILEK